MFEWNVGDKASTDAAVDGAEVVVRQRRNGTRQKTTISSTTTTARSRSGQGCRAPRRPVAAAGAILAGTFASMMLAGNTLFAEMGFSISFGICR